MVWDKIRGDATTATVVEQRLLGPLKVGDGDAHILDIHSGIGLAGTSVAHRRRFIAPLNRLGEGGAERIQSFIDVLDCEGDDVHISIYYRLTMMRCLLGFAERRGMSGDGGTDAADVLADDATICSTGAGSRYRSQVAKAVIIDAPSR